MCVAKLSSACACPSVNMSRSHHPESSRLSTSKKPRLSLSLSAWQPPPTSDKHKCSSAGAAARERRTCCRRRWWRRRRCTAGTGGRRRRRHLGPRRRRGRGRRISSLSNRGPDSSVYLGTVKTETVEKERARLLYPSGEFPGQCCHTSPDLNSLLI